MRRGAGRTDRRILGALVALLVLPSLTPDLFGLSCPHHAGGHGEGAPAHAVGTHEGTSLPTGAGTPSHGSTPGHGAPCTCAGSCPVSSGAGAPAAFAEVTPAATHLDAADPSPTAAAVLPSGPAHLLPFANGPPAA